MLYLVKFGHTKGKWDQVTEHRTKADAMRRYRGIRSAARKFGIVWLNIEVWSRFKSGAEVRIAHHHDCKP